MQACPAASLIRAARRAQAFFIKAHHRFGPYFAHQVVSRLYYLGTHLEDLSAGLGQCDLIRGAMDTATVSLAAWQILRKYACLLGADACLAQSLQRPLLRR